ILTLPLLWLLGPDTPPSSLGSLEGVTLSTVNGEKFKLSGLFSDKKILFVFWSITCATCIEEIPFIVHLHENWKDRLTIIGIHPPGFPLPKVQKFLRKFPTKIPYQIAIDDESALMKAFQVTILPKVVLSDRRGQILYSHLGYDQSMETEIENAIAEKL
ncbi:MAG TPA: TlpA disulfide reductase family protein, partial [Candidatus Ozemobacteraceae bacterium]|nr:TlpA disulfide reductase family protein [Candidatus Ozemobacteraceae bacterium]